MSSLSAVDVARCARTAGLLLCLGLFEETTIFSVFGDLFDLWTPCRSRLKDGGLCACVLISPAAMW